MGGATIWGLAAKGSTVWAGGARGELCRRDASGQWEMTPVGRSGSVKCIWAGEGDELLVGTEYMVEIG